MNTTRKNRWAAEVLKNEDENNYEDEDEFIYQTAEYKDIMKSIEQDPNDSSNYSLLGRYLFKNTKRRVGHYKRRIEHYVKFIVETKKIASESVKAMYKAIELDPNDSVNYSILANMLFNYEIIYKKKDTKPNIKELMNIMDKLEKAIKLNKYKGSKLASLNTNTILLKRLHSIVNPEIPNPKIPRPGPKFGERYYNDDQPVNNIEEGNESDNIPLNCRDCGGRFPFTKGEQEFYQLRGFVGEPTRCKECRAKKERDASQLTPRQPKLKKTPSPRSSNNNEATIKKRNIAKVNQKSVKVLKEEARDNLGIKGIHLMTEEEARDSLGIKGYRVMTEEEANRIRKPYAGPKPRTRSKHTRQGIPI